MGTQGTTVSRLKTGPLWRVFLPSKLKKGQWLELPQRDVDVIYQMAGLPTGSGVTVRTSSVGSGSQRKARGGTSQPTQRLSDSALCAQGLTVDLTTDITQQIQPPVGQGVGQQVGPSGSPDSRSAHTRVDAPGSSYSPARNWSRPTHRQAPAYNPRWQISTLHKRPNRLYLRPTQSL